MEIYLIRHTPVNLDKEICYGNADVDLQPGYAILFKDLKEKLAGIEFKYFYSSPLKRCTILANYLSGDHIITDSRLKELDFGDWEGKNWRDIEITKDFTKWKNDYYNLTTPDGESFKDLYNRCIDFYRDLSTIEHCTIAIVTHAGVIRSILSYELGLPIKNSFSLKIDYGSVSKIYIHKQITTIDFINR